MTMARPTAPSTARGAEWVRKNASTSWLTRHLGLWARNLEPLRPLCAPAARATDREASWPLPRDLSSAGRARRLARGSLRAWELDQLTDTAELLVSEVVGNALRHARGPLRLNLRATGDRLMCEVEDTCDTAPVRRTADLGAEGGRGLDLLDLLSESWGSARTATGKSTWFVLSAPSH
ncbi:ATP-binding protein [Streptomyces avidinii]|nr:ATP-binding protein [Streptomyces avidinii]